MATILQYKRYRDPLRFGLTFLFGIVSKIAPLCMMLILARHFGAREYGRINVIIGSALFLAGIVHLGWPMLVSKLGAAMIADGQLEEYRHLISSSEVWIWFAAGITCLTLVVCSIFFWQSSSNFVLIAVILLPACLTLLRGQQLSSLGHPSLTLLLDQTFAALFVIGHAFLFPLGNLIEIVSVYTVGLISGVVLSTIFIIRSIGFPRFTFQSVQNAFGYIHFAVPLMIVMVSQQLIYRVDILALAPFASLVDVGVFGLATRISYVMTIIPSIILLLLFPRISSGIWPPIVEVKIVAISVLVCAITGLAAAILFYMLGNFILVYFVGVFDSRLFQVTMICICGHLISGASFPFMAALMARTSGWVLASIYIFSFGICFSICFRFAGQFGAFSAAWGTVCMASVQILFTSLFYAGQVCRLRGQTY